MGYYINLENISIDDYKEKLRTGYLPPSRMILKENLNERFEYFKSYGLKNVKELLQDLKNKEHFEVLSKVKCFSIDYLKILLREINSTLPKPNRLKDFPGISCEITTKLEKIGIKNTAKLFDKVISVDLRKDLSDITGISEENILELTKLTDLSRIKWAGAKFARMLYDLDIDTVEKASRAIPEDLHKRVNAINKEKEIYKGQIGLNDIRVFIDAAKEVPLEIEY